MNLPHFGDNIPRKGNRFSMALGKFVLAALGWDFDSMDPPNIPKFVLVVAPHTSNWDGIIGFTALFAMGVRIHWMGKHTLFKGALGKFMTWLGGIPIERDAHHGMVGQSVEEFKSREQFILAITPEGTRRKVDHWKSGFYFIAQQAQVPIVTAFIDYGRKMLGFGPWLEPSGDIEKDMPVIQSHFVHIRAKHPAKFTLDKHPVSD